MTDSEPSGGLGALRARIADFLDKRLGGEALGCDPAVQTAMVERLADALEDLFRNEWENQHQDIFAELIRVRLENMDLAKALLARNVEETDTAVFELGLRGA